MIMYFMILFLVSAIVTAQSNYPSSTRLDTQSEAILEPSLDSTSVVLRRHVLSSRKIYKSDGFGLSTDSTGSGVSYEGNVGNPYGSNIIEVSSADADQYKYITRFRGSHKQSWTVVIWNKIGPDGALDGWYSHAYRSLNLTGGQTKTIAFDEISQGGWAAAPSGSLPIDSYGGYAST